MYFSVTHVEDYMRKWVALGFLVYLGAFFVLESSKILSFFLMCIVLPVLFMSAASRFRYVLDRRVLLSLLGFLGYLSLSSLWGDGEVSESIKYASYIFCLFLSITIFSQEFSEELTVKYIAVVGFIFSISYIIAILLSDNAIMDFVNERFSFRQIGGWGSKSPLDSATIISIPVLAACWLFPKGKWYMKLMLIATMIACVALVFVTKSRGPGLSLGITLMVISLIKRGESKFYFLLFFTLLLFMLSLLFFKDDVTVMRIDERHYRYAIWEYALDKIRNNWLFGQGYGTDAQISIADLGWELSHSHNMILEVLRVGGCVAGGLLVFMLVTMLRPSYIHSGNLFFLIWFFFGFLCMFFSARLLLIKPTVKEFVEFWLPLFLFYSFRKKTLSKDS
ncbi:MAG: hypothetical protein LBF93_12120 [Zoogloeaceae bacterium]|jgi:hypothetical protein|nr:hypothetical protein [Zoogloeaceae bacterium]